VVAGEESVLGWSLWKGSGVDCSVVGCDVSLGELHWLLYNSPDQVLWLSYDDLLLDWSVDKVVSFHHGVGGLDERCVYNLVVEGCVDLWDNLLWDNLLVQGCVHLWDNLLWDNLFVEGCVDLWDNLLVEGCVNLCVNHWDLVGEVDILVVEVEDWVVDEVVFSDGGC